MFVTNDDCNCTSSSSSESLGSTPVGVRCPISSSLGGFPSYWDWLWCPGLSPVLVSIALPFAFHTLCFTFALSAIGFQSCFFFTAGVYRHPFGRPFTC